MYSNLIAKYGIKEIVATNLSETLLLLNVDPGFK